MATCKGCDGYGLKRDKAAPDGWARDTAGNAVPCTCPNQSGGEAKPERAAAKPKARGGFVTA